MSDLRPKTRLFDNYTYPTISASASMTTLTMSDDEKAAAEKRQRRRPPFGFARVLDHHTQEETGG